MKKFLTSEEAIELLPDGEEIHTFYNFPMGLIGADWRREDIIEELKGENNKIEVCGESARTMGHGICVYSKGETIQSNILFIATNMEKLNELDPLPEKNDEQAAGVKSHSEKEIYQGCLRLIRQVVNYFEEYLDYLDIHQEDLAEEERFSVALSNFDIVQNLFLFSTTHSGGTSTRKKCKELGLDDSDLIEFRFKSDPEYDDEEDV